jgi:large subunit ribosomal protein L25
MSTHVQLHAKKREAGGSGAAGRLRTQGIVPAVIYGADQDNYSIQVDSREFGVLLRGTNAKNFLVDLQIEGAKEKTKLAMVQDMQQDPLSGKIIHIDFHAVNENQILSATVPLELVGEAEGVKEGGILDHQLHSIEVHCRPADLPEKLEIDITDLKMGDAVHISSLALPEGVEIGLDGDVVIAQVAEPRVATAEEEEAEAAAAAAAAGEPEVVGEKADGEDGDAAAES